VELEEEGKGDTTGAHKLETTAKDKDSHLHDFSHILSWALHFALGVRWFRERAQEAIAQ
jgi:hypothetical protein